MFRTKVRAATVTEPTTNPVRKQSFSATEGPSATCAPQLKIDANGVLTIDEERSERKTSFDLLDTHPFVSFSLYIRHVDETPRTAVVIDAQFNDDNLTHRSYRKIGRRKRWSNRGETSERLRRECRQCIRFFRYAEILSSLTNVRNGFYVDRQRLSQSRSRRYQKKIQNRRQSQSNVGRCRAECVRNRDALRKDIDAGFSPSRSTHSL